MSRYSDYRRTPLPKAKGPAKVGSGTTEHKARLAVRRLDGAWTDMDWSLSQVPSIKERRANRHAVSPLASAAPLRLQMPSPIGTVWTLAALLCSSQEPTSAPGQWATLGSERFRERASKHPLEVLPPPFEHSAYLYLFTMRFPPAAQQLGVHQIMDDPDVWATYTRRYRTGVINKNPVVRALLQSAETFVPPAQWPDYLLRVILRQAAVPFYPSPRRVADVLLMGAPLAPCFVPKQRSTVSITDAVEPYAFLTLILLGLTPEQLHRAGIPLPPERIAEIAASGLDRALNQSRIFRVWFSGVDTRYISNAHTIPESVHQALELDAYPPDWTKALGIATEFHVDKALRNGTARHRPTPPDEHRAPHGHTWPSLDAALKDPRNCVAHNYAKYYISKKDSPAVKSVIADLDYYPPDPSTTYGRVRPKDIQRRPLYALSRPETKAVLDNIARDLHQGIKKHRQERSR